jgi:23S rRNA (uracil1939-C5)-methyltransferase
LARRNSKYVPELFENVTIGPAAAQGNCVARVNDKVVFVKYAAPGDVADIRVSGKKKKFLIADIENLITPSIQREDTFCAHFGTCGGCKWQHLKYEYQLAFKEQEVKDALQRIGKVEPEEYLPIVGAAKTREYRNKVEYTFSNKAWIDEFDKENPEQKNALGFHVPKRFDKVLDLDECHLMPPEANNIRLFVKKTAEENNISFFDIRQNTGLLRNLMVRRTSLGHWMVLLAISKKEEALIETILGGLKEKFSFITSLLYVVNNKQNDTIYDLPVHTYWGDNFIEEKIGDYTFMIRPKSFFQTNTEQAKVLYDLAKEFADLKENEIAYDLYTGTGSIAIYNSAGANKIIGIEYVEDAVIDAKENAVKNGVTNCSFFAGDMKKVLNDSFIKEHGKPDVIITDPPRDGMHTDVVAKILEMEPKRIVYVSCNPATQARDLALLDEKYTIKKSRAVDMFPHTHHVENVVLLLPKA